MACTIVTAFYPIKSKFSKDKYLNWGKTFLKLDSPIVLFTEENLVEDFLTIRGNKPIKIITIPFELLESWVKYKDIWIQQHTIDPESDIHTPELYAIWAQKPIFVEKAIQCNPFQTSYFFWCDFGAFRNPMIPDIVLQSFPTVRYLPHDRILLQAMADLKETDKIIKSDGIYGECITTTWNEVRLVGGLWGGHYTGCLQWNNAYQTMLERYINAGRFAGKDQQVMLSTYINHPHLAYVVKSNALGIDNWFYLQYLLSSIDVPCLYNPTYFL